MKVFWPIKGKTEPKLQFELDKLSPEFQNCGSEFETQVQNVKTQVQNLKTQIFKFKTQCSGNSSCLRCRIIVEKKPGVKKVQF